MLANIVSTLEAAMEPFLPVKVDAKWDEKYYDTKQLTSAEQDQVRKTEFGAADPKVDIVTLGNWVNLPDMHQSMLKLFHYHQFVGTQKGKPTDHSRNPDEYLYVGCEHALKEGEGESGLPLNAILKAIY